METAHDAKLLSTAHDNLVRRIRRVAVFTLLLFVFAVNFYFEKIDRLQHEFALREDLLRSLPDDAPVFERLLAHVREIGRVDSSSTNPRLRLDSDQLPELARAIAHNQELKTAGGGYDAFGVRLPRHTYGALLAFGGSAALLVMWVTMRQLRSVHASLSPIAVEGGQLQRALNSLLFDRVTRKYGEHWVRHVVLAILPIVLLAAMTPAILTYSALWYLDHTLYFYDGRLSGWTSEGARNVVFYDRSLVSPYSLGGAVILIAVSCSFMLGAVTFLSALAVTRPYAAPRLLGRRWWAVAFLFYKPHGWIAALVHIVFWLCVLMLLWSLVGAICYPDDRPLLVACAAYYSVFAGLWSALAFALVDCAGSRRDDGLLVTRRMDAHCL